MNRSSTPPLQRSGVTFLRPRGASAPDPRESRGTSAPAVASAWSAGDPEEPNEVPGANKETKSHLQ